MDAFQFVSNYEKFVDELAKVVKPEYLEIVNKLKAKDPHDLVRPETFFTSESHARGFVYQSFLAKVFMYEKFKPQGNQA